MASQNATIDDDSDVDDGPIKSYTLSTTSESSCSENEGSSSQKTRKKRRQTPRLSSKLTPHLRGLMGEANLRYARGDVTVAEKMCFEVMRQAPEAYEPYLTLSQIYENTDSTKYRGYLTIASCLSSHNTDIWCRLAELNLQEDRKTDALSCYMQALRADPKDLDVHIKRLQLVEEMGIEHYILSCQRQLANALPRKQADRIIEVSKQVAQKYHKLKNYKRAVKVLEIPFKRIPKQVTPDLVNMLLELLIIMERYTECLEIFIEYCNFTFEITVDDDKNITVNSYVMPENVQIDIKVKLIICFIRLKPNDLFIPLIDAMIIDEDMETIGDLYLDIAEELMTVNLPNQALKLLVPLVKSKNYCLAAVWLKYAECLKACELHEQAVEAYTTVLQMAPQHIEVLYPLAMCLLAQNKKNEALTVLSQDLSGNKIDVGVLIERMKLLKQINDRQEYFHCAEILLRRHCLNPKYPEEIRVMMYLRSYSEKYANLKKIRTFRGDKDDIAYNYICINEPNVDDEYQYFKSILQYAFDVGEYAQFEKLAFMALSSKKFAKQFREIGLWALLACFYNDDIYHAYNLVREMVIKEPHNNYMWNLFNLFLQNNDDLRHNKFIMRYQERLPNTTNLQIIYANYGFAIGNYNFALKYFMREFKKTHSPYLAFLLGVMLLQNYSSKTAKDKKKLGETATHLFKYYANNRSNEVLHEIYYNLARMYQQLGMNYLAESYYLKLLEYETNHESIFSLKYEAAYNLHLIYKSSGNLIAARNVLYKYITI